MDLFLSDGGYSSQAKGTLQMKFLNGENVRYNLILHLEKEGG
jgi:hypothetical protein